MRLLRLCTVLGICLAPGLAASQTGVDLLPRYEAASETLSSNFMGFFLSRLPEHADKLPGTDWEDIDREIGTCVLTQIEEQSSYAAAESLVGVIESMAAMQISTFADYVSVTMVQITDATALVALSECGQQDRAFMRDYEAGLIDLFNDPAIVARLQSD